MERKRISEADRDSYIAAIQRRNPNPELIELVKKDIEWGLSQAQIDDYVLRHLEMEQREAVSDMHKKGYPGIVIAAIGATHIDASRMRAAMELYDNHVPLDEIKTALAETDTADELKKAYSRVLKNVQKSLAITPKQAEGEDAEPEYVQKIMDDIKAVAEAIHFQEKRYDALNAKISEIEVSRMNDVAVRSLTELNEKLQKENDELCEQLCGKQDEIAKGLQSMSKLRSEVENNKEEMKIMQDRIKELEKQSAAKDEMIREQAQAITKKEAVIHQYENNTGQGEADGFQSNRNSVNIVGRDFVTTDKMPAEKSENKNGRFDIRQNGAVTVNNSKSNIPVHYAMTCMQGNELLQREELAYVQHKPSVLSGIIKRFVFRKKSHRNFVEMVIRNELTPEQICEIKEGLALGLNEEQLGLIINKNLSPERIKSIVSFAALQNSLNVKGSEQGE